ncbi:unnamed protein product [Nippostrongylus brasiliensis]|uniref:Uncharacterized protein n=1 Tax=Nippostrongylus brasiliensis TaxID=27835 RepID=A0A0N4XIE5_NIPBR|nr:unnamed protein product [Nippostrongylus brasiliensis]
MALPMSPTRRERLSEKLDMLWLAQPRTLPIGPVRNWALPSMQSEPELRTLDKLQVTQPER